jgi:hypothetical protein
MYTIAYLLNYTLVVCIVVEDNCITMGLLSRITKYDVCDQFLDQIRRRGDIHLSTIEAEDLIKHFKSLPTRYALDVNTDGLDVLNHNRLLDCARADPGSVSFQVRTVDVAVSMARGESESSFVDLSGNVLCLCEVCSDSFCTDKHGASIIFILTCDLCESLDFHWTLNMTN